jgi:hypothetical protein
MARGVARVLVRYGAAGDPGDSGVDPEKTQAKEEEGEDDGEDECVCVCCISFVSRSLYLSRSMSFPSIFALLRGIVT